MLLDLYNEKAGILDGDAEVDLGSYAYQVWKNAIDDEPTLERRVGELPPVVYDERLKRHLEALRGTLFDLPELHCTVDEIYRYPLRTTAVEVLNRQLRAGIDDADLAKLVLSLREEDRLCLVSDEEARPEPQIICSLGLRDPRR